MAKATDPASHTFAVEVVGQVNTCGSIATQAFFLYTLVDVQLAVTSVEAPPTQAHEVTEHVDASGAILAGVVQTVVGVRGAVVPCPTLVTLALVRCTVPSTICFTVVTWIRHAGI